MRRHFSERGRDTSPPHLKEGEWIRISPRTTELEIVLFRPVPGLGGGNPVFFDTVACVFSGGEKVDYVGVGRSATDSKAVIRRPHIILTSEEASVAATAAGPNVSTASLMQIGMILGAASGGLGGAISSGGVASGLPSPQVASPPHAVTIGLVTGPGQVATTPSSMAMPSFPTVAGACASGSGGPPGATAASVAAPSHILPGDSVVVNLRQLDMALGLVVCATLFTKDVSPNDLANVFYVVRKPRASTVLAVIPVRCRNGTMNSCASLMIKRRKQNGDSAWHLICLNEPVSERDVRGVVLALQGRGLRDPDHIQSIPYNNSGFDVDDECSELSDSADTDNSSSESGEAGGTTVPFDQLLANVPHVYREGRRQYSVGRSAVHRRLEEGDSSGDDEVLDDALRAVVPAYGDSCVMRYASSTYNVGSRAKVLTEHYIANREAYGTYNFAAVRRAGRPPVAAPAPTSSGTVPADRLSDREGKAAYSPIPPDMRMSFAAGVAHRRSGVQNAKRGGRRLLRSLSYRGSVLPPLRSSPSIGEATGGAPTHPTRQVGEGSTAPHTTSPTLSLGTPTKRALSRTSTQPFLSATDENRNDSVLREEQLKARRSAHLSPQRSSRKAKGKGRGGKVSGTRKNGRGGEAVKQVDQQLTGEAAHPGRRGTSRPGAHRSHLLSRKMTEVRGSVPWGDISMDTSATDRRSGEALIA